MQQPHEPSLRCERRAAFLAWAEQQPGKWERLSAVVHAVPPERLDHNRIKLNVLTALTEAIRAAEVPCEAFVGGPLVMTGASNDFVPDVVANQGERTPGASLSVDRPVIVVEVLSPAPGRRDPAVRLDGYFALPTVQHDLMVAPDLHLVIHHSRLGPGRILTQLHRLGAEITLAPPGLHIQMADLYLGTDLAQ